MIVNLYMEVKKFCQTTLENTFNIKDKIKDNHYLKLCNLLEEIYHDSEYMFPHKCRVLYSYLNNNDIYEFYTINVMAKEKLNLIWNHEWDTEKRMKGKINGAIRRADWENIFFNNNLKKQFREKFECEEVEINIASIKYLNI